MCLFTVLISLHYSFFLVQYSNGSFKKGADFQSFGKFLFVGLFCIISVSLNIPIVTSSEFLAFIHSVSSHGAVYYCTKCANCENFFIRMDHLISRNGDHHWPPKSCDLTLLIFSLGVLLNHYSYL